MKLGLQHCMKWFPWRSVLRRIALHQGFLDPISLLARVQQFAEPSEVQQPLELLRAGSLFHARGLINTQAIQHNLDWLWPYWVVRQFDPSDQSFIPRAFSITHVNLTHRNWTALAIPNFNEMPIVDPRGLVTPFWDGWSLDFWILNPGGEDLIPSRCRVASQGVNHDEDISIVTLTTCNDLLLREQVSARLIDGVPCCVIDLLAYAKTGARLAVALRPYNPEGVSFIDQITTGASDWTVNRKHTIKLSEKPDWIAASSYAHGDVYHRTEERYAASTGEETLCKVGMASTAAVYKILPDCTKQISVSVPLADKTNVASSGAPDAAAIWKRALQGAAALEVPDPLQNYLFKCAIWTLIVLSPDTIYPGPFTYKRFWFRDAALMCNGLIACGLLDRVRAIIDTFPKRQRRDGYFESQHGEWDSNGEALWLYERYFRASGTKPTRIELESIEAAANWIKNKRLLNSNDLLLLGLLPSGFSAEHFGPSDYYYWDDFWAVAGLNAAGYASRRVADAATEKKWLDESLSLLAAVEQSIARSQTYQRMGMVPAAPRRRMDSGAIGALVAGYPLKLWGPQDSRLLKTADWLLKRATVKNLFFQEMVHSGCNPYLTLHLAQVLLRAGDARVFTLSDAVAHAASSTGQWPEAIHPLTDGGCMGDGQHGWAAAEWILMMRALFLREEGDELVILPGLRDEWLQAGKHFSYERAGCDFGVLSVRCEVGSKRLLIEWQAEWSEPPKAIVFRGRDGLLLRAAPHSGRMEVPI